MKKLVLLSTICSTFIGLSAFGQGYISFSSGKSQVYDGLGASSIIGAASSLNVALLWGPTTAVPALDSLLASTPTTGISSPGTVESYTLATAWSDILSDPNGFQLAEDVLTSAVAVDAVNSRGATTYGNFGVIGTTATDTYAFLMVAWNGAYATPLLASENNSAVGWSPVFDYATTVGSNQSGSMPSTGLGFGVFSPGAIPEPTTMALAGLGGLSLLLFRRRK